jgi:hypothetical protein
MTLRLGHSRETLVFLKICRNSFFEPQMRLDLTEIWTLQKFPGDWTLQKSPIHPLLISYITSAHVAIAPF